MVQLTYLVHSITTDNEDNLATGWLPGQLSSEGIKRARGVAEQLMDSRFDVVFCSDLTRAIHSTELFFGNRFPVIQDDRLREANYGDYNGQPSALFKEHMTDYVDQPFPNGESYRDVEARLQSFVDFLRKHYEGKHVAVVAHQGPQLALDVIIKGKSWQQAIAEDWRKNGSWQPGWEYEIS